MSQASPAARAASATSVRGPDTNPLPVYTAYLIGPSGNAGAFPYTGTVWTSTAITQDMVFINPNPTNAAADLDGDATRRANAIAAGYAANYFVLNPAVGTVSVTDSGAFSDYHALQIDLRRQAVAGHFGQRQLSVRDGRGLVV